MSPVVSGQGSLCPPRGSGCHGRDHWHLELPVKSLSSHFKAGKMETGAGMSWDLGLSEAAVEFLYKHGAPVLYFPGGQPSLDPFLLWGVIADSPLPP